MPRRPTFIRSWLRNARESADPAAYHCNGAQRCTRQGRDRPMPVIVAAFPAKAPKMRCPLVPATNARAVQETAEKINLNN